MHDVEDSDTDGDQSMCGRWSRTTIPHNRCLLQSDGDADDDETPRASPQPTSHNRQAEFALRFVVEGQEFWDNNQGHNYVVDAIPLSVTTPPKSPTRSILRQSSV